MPKVKIDFKFDGTMKTEAEGFEGGKCVTATNNLIEAIAKRQTDQRFKTDYYVNENAVNIGN